MKHNVELPKPWEHVETLSPEKQDALEETIGTRLTYDDLGEFDTRTTGHGKEPLSRKSWLVMGHRWVRIRNQESSLEAILRLQTFDGVSVSISSVAFPTRNDALDMSGSDLRSLPIAALAAAYSYDEQAGRANLSTFLQLMEEISNEIEPLDALPPASKTAKFSALVARQYRHIEDAEPGAYVARRMSEINNRPLPTIQRWITQSRKAGFLPPSSTGRRPSG